MERLTTEQQALVARHMGLARLYVRRQLQQLPIGTAKFDKDDLEQVACLGLMHAAARHQPDRCGPFAAYCLKFIRGAVCRYMLEQMEGLAMSASTRRAIVMQRHRREKLQALAAATDAAEEIEQPAFQEPEYPLPHFHSLDRSVSALAALAYHQARDKIRQEQSTSAHSADAAHRAAQLRFHLEQAIHWTVAEANLLPRVRIDHAALVQAIVQERFLVPRAECRTSNRLLARRFGCSRARVWTLEKRLLRLVAKYLVQQAGMSREAATLVCPAAVTASPGADTHAVPDHHQDVPAQPLGQ